MFVIISSMGSQSVVAIAYLKSPRQNKRFVLLIFKPTVTHQITYRYEKIMMLMFYINCGLTTQITLFPCPLYL